MAKRAAVVAIGGNSLIKDKAHQSCGDQYLAEGKYFKSGSMALKIQASIWFLEAGGKEALITNPENTGRALRGETRTLITNN